jgi:hypothetical protein
MPMFDTAFSFQTPLFLFLPSRPSGAGTESTSPAQGSGRSVWRPFGSLVMRFLVSTVSP